MKKFIAAFLLCGLVAGSIPMIAGSAWAGNCDTASDRAADGSRCGGRAADERDGGN